MRRTTKEYTVKIESCIAEIRKEFDMIERANNTINLKQKLLKIVIRDKCKQFELKQRNVNLILFGAYRDTKGKITNYFV